MKGSLIPSERSERGMTDVQDPEVLTQEAAFERCDSYAFDGIDLEPCVPQRWAAARACGLAYGTQEAREGLVEVGKDKDGAPMFTYRKLQFDVALILYLCSIPPKQVRVAFRDPDAVIGGAMEFLDAHGMLPDSDKLQEGLSVFSRIIEDMNVSTSTPKTNYNGKTADPN